MITMNIPITQSALWAKLQEDLGEVSVIKSSENFHYLAILKTTPVGNYLYLPYGPVYANQKGFAIALKSLIKLAKEKNAIFIRVEPQDSHFSDYAPSNAKKSHDLNPKETWLLDLTGTDDEFKSRLPSRLLRYHRAAIKKGITITASHNPTDVKHLLALQRVLADQKGISTFSSRYLETELSQPFSTLYLINYHPVELIHETSQQREKSKNGVRQADDSIIAAGLVFDDDTTRYNLQGAQSDLGRRLHATGILTIQLILDARAKGLTTFDFWGIAPENAPDTHPWAGFTTFKKTFAGYEQDYAGTYDIVIKPIKYKAYQAFRRTNRLIRRAK